MLWCPKCKLEYADDAQACTTCGKRLTEAPPPVLLATLEPLNADAAQALLEDAGIPVFAHQAVCHQPTAITGLRPEMSLYVPPDRLEEARDILQVLAPPPEEDEEHGEPRPAGKAAGMFAHRHRIIAIIILALFLLGLWFGIIDIPGL